MAKTAYQKILVNNWGDFNDLASHFQNTMPPIMGHHYRGQSDESWDLVPSFHRHFHQELLSEEDILLKIEKYASDAFDSQSHLYVSTNIFNAIKGVLGRWMLMQHHHVPTRLLDWTLSMYVATYHACRDNFNRDGAIWALHGGFLHNQMETIYKTEPLPPRNLTDNFFLDKNSSSETFFILPKLRTDRMVAQQGTFSVCRNISKIQHEIILDACAKDKYFNFVKILIPHGLKVEFLRKLRAMNITAGSLFPGLDGLGQSVNELVLLNAHEEENEILKNKATTIGDILGSKNIEHDKK